MRLFRRDSSSNGPPLPKRPDLPKAPDSRKLKMRDVVLTRVYEAKGGSAEKKVNKLYGEEATKLARTGYLPTSVALQRSPGGGLVKSFNITSPVYLFVTYTLNDEEQAKDRAPIVAWEAECDRITAAWEAECDRIRADWGTSLQLSS